MNEKHMLSRVLKSEIELMNRAAKALKRSWEPCRVIHFERAAESEVDQLELLSSRFSRLSDFMIQRIFRLIDELDLEPSGTVRDVINRA